MMYSRYILPLALLLLVSVNAAPAANPIPYIDYMLMARTAKIVLECDPPSCRPLMNRDEDFVYDRWVISRATRWIKDWGRLRVLDDVQEADLVLHLDCGQPNLRDLLYGLRHRWMKMEVYAGGHESWRKGAPIWKGKLDPVPECDCRDAVVHILTEYRAEIERLDRVRGQFLPRGLPRPVLRPSPPAGR
ncbi:MAG: hypothetical protein L0Z53_06895 [Acidobacteriales bacterium]|nr:hypothetical protein [Terriglobales bacterium]